MLMIYDLPCYLSKLPKIRDSTFRFKTVTQAHYLMPSFGRNEKFKIAMTFIQIIAGGKIRSMSEPLPYSHGDAEGSSPAPGSTFLRREKYLPTPGKAA